jgi:hypothetical protein
MLGGKRVCACMVLVGKPDRGAHLEDPGMDGRITLRWIFNKWDGEVWTGLIWLRIVSGGSIL